MLALSPGAKHIDKHIMSLCGVEEVITMHRYVVSVYRKMGNSSQTRNTLRSIFTSPEGYAKSIVKNMKLAMESDYGVASNVSIHARSE